MERKNDIPLYGEEIIIEKKSEQEVIMELRERLNVLEGENKELEKKQLRIDELEKGLAEERRHASRMDSFFWDVFRAKEKLERELEEARKGKEKVEQELKKEKERSIKLEEDLVMKKIELQKEQTWWNSWLTDSNHSISQEALLNNSDDFFTSLTKLEKANIYNLENIFTQKYIGASKEWNNNLLEAKQGLIKVLQELKEKYKEI